MESANSAWRMADYFDTSVDYIIGHTDVRRRIEAVEPCCLNSREMQLIDHFRSLDNAGKACVETVVQTLQKR